MLFVDVPEGPIDPMNTLKIQLDSDTYPGTVDIGAGVYRGEDSEYYEFPVIKKAKKILDIISPGHDYQATTGIPTFIEKASKLVFGEQCTRLKEQKIVSCQTISGTGSCHLAAVFLQKFYKVEGKTPKVYVGTPAWGNYLPLFKHAGLATETYKYYDLEKLKIDFPAILQAVKEAPNGSIFVLQACCHNPTGADLSKVQWKELAVEMKARKHFPLFDMAYQGFASGDPKEDAWAVRYFEQQGFDMIVCQSFSKNMGLYAERAGLLHVVLSSPNIAAKVKDQVRCIVRWEFSTSPAYGAMLVDIVLGNPTLEREWMKQLAGAAFRLQNIRKTLYQILTEELKTPGHWENIVEDHGLFSMLPLTGHQVDELRLRHHVYLPPNGRINIAGLNAENMHTVASAIDAVVRCQTS